MIIYNKNSTINNSAIGKLETPIKMIIEHESDILSKKGGVCSTLFNVEKSNHFGETIITRRDFDVFQASPEGGAAAPDTIYDTGKKFIEHVQYMKEFIVTAEMYEDAQNGVAAEAKRRAENFTRAYYKTINNLCTLALANGSSPSLSYANTTIDLTTADGYSLFSKDHKWGDNSKNGVQSNYFYGDIFSTGTSGTRKASTEAFEESLTELAFKIRNMKGENGEILGYTADTIILPGNRPTAEVIAKKVCGSNGSLGGGNNDININYGNWNIVVMPGWVAEKDMCLIMSSEANRNLSGNMFFNRVPLTVTNWVDNHTGNYIWNGRCRFGVGFGTYKHILLAVDSETAVNYATKL
jgi:hypothetical protein